MDTAGIRRIAVVGAGLMGHGIAQEFAAKGYEVWLHDRTEDILGGAVRSIAGNLALLREMGLLSPGKAEAALANIRTTTEFRQTAAEVDVVIEAVSEDLALKQRIFRELDALCPAHTILASNTSTFRPSLLAAATRRPDKVLVAHYFNPPHLVPLVELVPGPGTADETLATMHALLWSIGKRPAVVRREAPGFVGNRLQIALLREAVSIVEQGIASPQDVDTIVRYGFGRRLAAAGPFEVFDAAGWDVVHAVAAQLLPQIASSTDIPPSVAEMVGRGELGIKTGQGFYAWTPASAAALKERIGRALVEIARWPDADADADAARPGGETA